MTAAAYPPAPSAGRSFLRSSRRLSAVGGAVIGVAIAAAVLLVWDLRRDTTETYQNDMNNTGVLVADQMSRSLQSVDLIVQDIVEHVGETGVQTPKEFAARMGSREFHDFLVDDLKSLPQADALALVSADGSVLNLTSVWPVPAIDISDSEAYRYIHDHDDAKVYISPPLKSRAAGVWTFFIVRRIDNARGEFLGMASCAITIHYLEDFYQTINLHRNGSITFLNRDGTILARYPHLENILGAKMSSPNWLTAVREGGGAVFLRGFDGREHYVSVRPVPGFPMVVNVSIPVSDALTNWRLQASAILVATVFVVAGVALLFSALAAQFRRLENQTQEMTHNAVALRAAKEEAESANRTKSMFLATMSHELRTPLNAVIGFSQIMEQGMFGPQPARYREYATLIHRSGEHLLTIINDILDIAKLQSGKTELRLETASLGVIVDEAVRLVAPRAQEAGLALSQEIAPNIPPVRVDVTRIRQVLLNLLSNAIKFTPSSGQVSVSARVWEGAVMLSVSDTGIGMNEADIPKALEPFGQVANAMTRAHEGTGLGLPLSKSLVELHGGHFEIVSAYGKGTTVIITLPAAVAGVGDDPAALWRGVG